MSTTKLMLDVVNDLRSLAESVAALAERMAGNDPEAKRETRAQAEPTTTTPTKPAPAPAPEQQSHLAPNEHMDPVTGEITRLELPELRALAASKARTKEQKAAMKALLAKYDAEKLTELALEHYFAFREEVLALE